ncbi:hypothetical protein [Nocardia xishanensis]
MRRTCRGPCARNSAPRTSVSAIEPGIVGTELQNHVTDAGAQKWLEGSKQEMTWLDPEDIAEAVNFLASQPAHVNLQQVTIMPTRQPS